MDQKELDAASAEETRIATNLLREVRRRAGAFIAPLPQYPNPSHLEQHRLDKLRKARATALLKDATRNR